MVSRQLIEEILELMRLLRRSAHPVRRGEMTPEQYWLLRRLNRAGPLSVSELAARLGIGQSSATSACKRLERQGLLTRTRQRGDERVVLCTLTEQGHERIEKWSRLRREATGRYLECLDDAEQAQLEELLARVLSQAEAMNTTPIVAVDHLTRRFADKAAVDDVSFTIEPGEVFGLLGPNGAGKTKTIRILMTLIAPTSGTIRIGGFDVRRAGARLRRVLGYVPQNISTDGTLTARENLLIVAKLLGLGREEREQRIDDILGLLNLEEAADHLVRTYSGGMVRRLEVGQAILHRPRLLVLDEPTVGLDPTARQAIWHMLSDLKEESGMTILITTHYMEEADSYCGRVAVMNRGRIARIGRPEELKASIGRPDATLEDVFTAVTGDSMESGGSFRDLKQLGRRQRLG